LSPFTVTWDCVDSDPGPLFLHAVSQLDQRELAFLEIVERMEISVATADGGKAAELGFSPADLRKAYRGNLIVNGAYHHKRAEQAVASGHAQCVSFARSYISNPDLAERLAAGAELNPDANMLTAYGGGAEGYTDYPVMEDRVMADE
jgi:N-ethylmaleimide reductase